jgi:two-component system cell cycle sensor histidine kinase/response regulator CckA
MASEKQKLLLVEDEVLVALDLKRRLEGMGFEVAGQASTGEEAIRKTTDLKPALVLMDIGLGGVIDGIEATETIRRRLDVPVVYLSSSSDDAVIKRARATDHHGFVQKPIKDRELRVAIEMALYRFKAEAVIREGREWFMAALGAIREAAVSDDKTAALGLVESAMEHLAGWKAEEARGKPMTEMMQYLREAALTLPSAAARGGTGGRDPQRQAHQQQAHQQQTQKSKMEAIGRLAAGVAHDFNNHLTAIIGYSNLALMKSTGSDPGRDDIVQIKEAGEKASELTQQLLAFSRRQMLTPTVVDLGELTRGMSKLLERVIGGDIEVRTGGDKPLWPVKVDLGQMEQVLMNLAVHARDAMPHGGKLMVETRNLELTPGEEPPEEGMAPGRYVQLGVSDSGPGLDEETRAHLFEPFFEKGRAKGTGLGLASVYGIVVQSGGHLTVDAFPGMGTSFRIFLPVTGEAPNPSRFPGASSIASADGDETILIVEDEKTVRRFLRETLERKGYRVLEAGNAGEALELAAEAASRGGTLPGNEGEIRLMLTDVVMEGMNGLQLADEVLGLLPGIKVLYISGYTENALLHRGVIDEGLDLLRKPFTPKDLAGKVRRMLDGS